MEHLLGGEPWERSLRCADGRPIRGARGEFYSQELFEGRHIFNRFIWTVTSHDVCRWEQAFSVDGGRSWETNWIMGLTRQARAGS
jgi:hypothetical protein